MNGQWEKALDGRYIIVFLLLSRIASFPFEFVPELEVLVWTLFISLLSYQSEMTRE